MRTCGASRSTSEYTATVDRPRSLQVRITRTAISPRLATRTRRIGRIEDGMCRGQYTYPAARCIAHGRAIESSQIDVLRPDETWGASPIGRTALADPNTRQGKRTPVTLKIKFKSETLEQFIERYAVDVSQGGIFIRTKEPLAVGTQMKFEFQLRDASPLIAGEGTVVWTRENDPSRPAIAPGMGVRFDKLLEGSQAVLERILAEKAKQAPSRGNESVTKPPMFTDTPTRVAPAPVQEALGVGRAGGRRREDSEQTPLPKPMPFHSDAEDFDERAFEEATKVRSLDELAAQSAGLGGLADMQAPLGNMGDEDHDPRTATKIMPADELAARRTQGRADSTLADPPLAEPPAEERYGVKSEPDRDSAPGLPSPPERPKMLDQAPARTTQPSTPPADTARTKLGMEPA